MDLWVFKTQYRCTKVKTETVAEFIPWDQNSNLFELKVMPSIKNKVVLSSCEKLNKWKLWHCRLGHLSVNNMKKINAEDIEFNKENMIDEFCESCAVGKQSKQAHKTIQKQDKDTDHVIIHSDLI